MSLRALTMRKLFAGVTLTSLAGVAIVGGVFAWKASDSARGAALVGRNQFEVKYEPNCNAPIDQAITDDDGVVIPCLTLIGWNGQTTLVGKGFGQNRGDFKLSVTGGKIEIRRVLPPGPSPLAAEDEEEIVDPALCAPNHFGGRVNILDRNPIPPGGEGGRFEAYLKVAENAPPRCQGAIVIYKVTIEAENPNIAPEAPAE